MKKQLDPKPLPAAGQKPVEVGFCRLPSSALRGFLRVSHPWLAALCRRGEEALLAAASQSCRDRWSDSCCRAL